ncbi:hypothetical protein CISG_01877 [Coccidioides immitis RMSCC 3703]|nr:hypothetical protein CIRG_08520 [Coccidioides immitis RMSCC 2394]KMU78837.1 hypothetical protein CISG_01877 [Coccidioides immitis RMSCC 3703]
MVELVLILMLQVPVTIAGWKNDGGMQGEPIMQLNNTNTGVVENSGGLRRTVK